MKRILAVLIFISITILITGSGTDIFAAGSEPTIGDSVPAAQTADQNVALAEAIVAKFEADSGRPLDPAYRVSLVNDLASRPTSQLDAIQSGAGLITTQNLGDSASDLVYTPVAPCRIIDTRLAGGAIAANTLRNFFAVGSPFNMQGGTSGDCGIPFGPATAVAINFVAVGASGPGDLRAWAYGDTMPNASILNYGNASYVGTNLANAITVPICNPGTAVNRLSACAYDMVVQADVNSTQVVADVVGYFRKVRTEQVKSFSQKAVSSGTTAVGATCTNYKTITVTAPTGVAGTVLVRADAVFQLNHTNGTADEVVPFLSATSGTECSTSYAGNIFLHLPAELPTSTSYLPISLSARFPVSAGAAATFYLNVRNNSGSMNFFSSAMDATFIPN
ncbi:MAG: hypothetical protein M0Z71_07945 [Nitrospiraceae bacterium]|nr:hypothetical protein [Nitrospiraceae bacterium]